MERGYDDLVARVRDARADRTRVVLEGLHAVKHARRFGAELELLLTPDAGALARLVDALAPDLAPLDATPVDPDTWDALAGGPLPSPALGVCRRPDVEVAAVLADPAPSPVVLLEDPTHLGNLGAVVRVAAAAGAGGVLTTGRADPWHPAAVRGGAGLQLAVPTARLAGGVADLDDVAHDRPLVAFDAGGIPLAAGALPARGLLAFGTERHGLSDDVRRRADLVVSIPMRSGVSSLNLATAVAVALYAG